LLLDLAREFSAARASLAIFGRSRMTLSQLTISRLSLRRIAGGQHHPARMRGRETPGIPSFCAVGIVDQVASLLFA
jgi:hypothetical protein